MNLSDIFKGEKKLKNLVLNTENPFVLLLFNYKLIGIFIQTGPKFKSNFRFTYWA